MQDAAEEFLSDGGVAGPMASSPVHRDSSRIELAVDTLRACGALRLRVNGSSMLPSIWPGDELLIRRCSLDDAQPGDIVLYIRHARFFAHRVISKQEAGLVTQGDGIADPDPFVGASQILGKVSKVARRGKVARAPASPTLCGRVTAALVRRSARSGRLLARLHGLRNRFVP